MTHYRFASTISRWIFPILLLSAVNLCTFPLFTSPNGTAVVQPTTPAQDGGVMAATPTQAGEIEKTPMTCETRGAWIKPGAFYGYYCDDPQSAECWPTARRDPKVIDQINRLLDQLESAHLNTLFVASPRVDENCGWANRFAFEDFVELAKQRGFSLHMWVLSKVRSSPECDLDSQQDFTDPQEKYRQAEWIMNLMNIYGDDFDGVHLDYIRYSDWDRAEKEKMGSIDPTTGEEIGISATVRQIHQALQENYPGKKLSAAVFTLEPQYASSYQEGGEVKWKEDIPLWFDQWFNANRGNWYDDAPTDNFMVPLYMKYQQDPVGWLRESSIDGIMPMQYTLDDEEWNNELDQWKIFTQFELDNYNKVFMGLIWATDFGHDPGHIVRKIKYGRSQGARGYVIFTLGEWDDSANNGDGDFFDDTPLIDALTIDSAENDFDAPFKDTIPSCLAPE